LWLALHGPIEASRHPIGIIIVVVAIVFIGGLLLRLPLVPRLGSTFLERLPLEALLLFLLFRILYGLMLLRGGAPFLVLGVILLHRSLRGPSVSRPLSE
jgi:hypothetical protein